MTSQFHDKWISQLLGFFLFLKARLHLVISYNDIVLALFFMRSVFHGAILLLKMGRVFLEHPGGSRIFCCSNCETPLTNRKELVSTRFTGSTGRAFLFRKVVNISFSEVQDRMMLTGQHFVRDVFCKKCTNKLGWFYEFATEEDQRYKEGMCRTRSRRIARLLRLD